MTKTKSTKKRAGAVATTDDDVPQLQLLELIEAKTPTLGLPVKGLTRTALHLANGLDKSGWEQAGRWLGSVNGALQWWWGDWLHHGLVHRYIARGRYDVAEALS